MASSAAAKPGAFAQRAEAQAGAHRHQAERQRGVADALQRRGGELGQAHDTALASKPATVARISGLRASSRQ